VFAFCLQPVMLGITTMQLFQAWVRDNAHCNEIAAYNSQLLIVGMSATALESEQEAAFDYGMHFFCPKPANMDVLGLMLDAKRACPTNEAALDVICAATGTDYFTEAVQEYMNADMAEGDEGAENDGLEGYKSRSNSITKAAGRATGHSSGLSSVGAVSHEASHRGNSWTDLSALSGAGAATENSIPPEGESSAKASSHGSGKGINASSEAGRGGVVTGSEGEATSMGIPTAHSSASLAGSLSGNSVSSAVGGVTAAGVGASVGSPGMPHAKAVTDSKSAAMWSVFRSYRQSTRTVVVSPPAGAALDGAVSGVSPGVGAGTATAVAGEALPT
jgi:hypothetical protein